MSGMRDKIRRRSDECGKKIILYDFGLFLIKSGKKDTSNRICEN